LAIGCSRQQHVRQIDASNQQNEAYRSHQASGERSKPKILCLAEVRGTPKSHRDRFVGRKCLGLRELARQNACLSLGLSKTYSGREAAEYLELAIHWFVEPITFWN